MKPVLKILPAGLDSSRCVLVCEISNDGFRYVIKDDDANTYVALAAFQFEKSKRADDYLVMFENEVQQQHLLSGGFKKVFLTYSVNESVLVPFSLSNPGEIDNVLNLIHGDLHGKLSLLTDVIDKNKIYNGYRVPTDVLNIFKSKFPGAITRHQYSVLIEQVRAETHRLLVIFYAAKMVLVLNKNGSILFINTFSYNTNNDALYILLNTCQQFGEENVAVELSGMIEINSMLAEDIRKYFGSVGFAPLPAGCNFSEPIRKLPSHYFSYLFETGICG